MDRTPDRKEHPSDPQIPSEAGHRASVDRAGEVHGSGSGAGGGNPNEDYDDSAGGGGEVRATQLPKQGR